MAEGPQLDLDRGDFREIPRGPLGKPKDLWYGLAVWTVGALLSAFAGWHTGGFLGALFPIPCAVWAGVALAGLFPAWFFGKAN